MANITLTKGVKARGYTPELFSKKFNLENNSNDFKISLFMLNTVEFPNSITFKIDLISDSTSYRYLGFPEKINKIEPFSKKIFNYLTNNESINDNIYFPSNNDLLNWFNQSIDYAETTIVKTIPILQKKILVNKKQSIKKEKSFQNGILPFNTVPGIKKERMTAKKKAFLMEYLQNLPNELCEKINEIRSHFQKNPWNFFKVDENDFAYLISDENFHSVYSIREPVINGKHEIDDCIEKWYERVMKNSQHTMELPYRIILKLVNASPKYGRTTYAKWLTCSKDPYHEAKALDKNYLNILSHIKYAKTLELIDEMITKKYFMVTTVGEYHHSVLKVNIANKYFFDFVDDLATLSITILMEQKNTIPPTKKLNETFIKDYNYWSLQFNEKISLKNNEIFMKFLDTDIKDWQQEDVISIYKILNEKVANWQSLVKWAIFKHPIKNKHFNKLLNIVI